MSAAWCDAIWMRLDFSSPRRDQFSRYHNRLGGIYDASTAWRAISGARTGGRRLRSGPGTLHRTLLRLLPDPFPTPVAPVAIPPGANGPSMSFFPRSRSSRAGQSGEDAFAGSDVFTGARLPIPSARGCAHGRKVRNYVSIAPEEKGGRVWSVGGGGLEGYDRSPRPY